MRVDSNTKGHLHWYNFKAISKKKQMVRLNICNFKKCKNLYQRGMRPYILSNIKNIGQWIQQGQNITFKKKKLRYYVLAAQFTDEYYI